MNENNSTRVLGGLVEFFSYVSFYTETTKLHTVYTPSFPGIVESHEEEKVALRLLKDKLAVLPLDGEEAA